jgi:hypothetical protein
MMSDWPFVLAVAILAASAFAARIAGAVFMSRVTLTTGQSAFGKASQCQSMPHWSRPKSCPRMPEIRGGYPHDFNGAADMQRGLGDVGRNDRRCDYSFFGSDLDSF